MQTVNTRHELKRASANVVLVSSVDRVYQRHGDEWIEKARFSMQEVAEELEVPYQTLQTWVTRLNLSILHRRHRGFRLKEIRLLMRVKKLRSEKVSLSKIRLNLYAGTNKGIKITGT